MLLLHVRKGPVDVGEDASDVGEKDRVFRRIHLRQRRLEPFRFQDRSLLRCAIHQRDDVGGGLCAVGQTDQVALVEQFDREAHAGCHFRPEGHPPARDPVFLAFVDRTGVGERGKLLENGCQGRSVVGGLLRRASEKRHIVRAHRVAPGRGEIREPFGECELLLDEFRPVDVAEQFGPLRDLRLHLRPVLLPDERKDEIDRVAIHAGLAQRLKDALPSLLQPGALGVVHLVHVHPGVAGNVAPQGERGRHRPRADRRDRRHPRQQHPADPPRPPRTAGEEPVSRSRRRRPSSPVRRPFSYRHVLDRLHHPDLLLPRPLCIDAHRFLNRPECVATAGRAKRGVARLIASLRPTSTIRTESTIDQCRTVVSCAVLCDEADAVSRRPPGDGDGNRYDPSDRLMVIRSITSGMRWRRLIDRLSGLRGTMVVSGVWGASARLVAAEAARRSSRTSLYITAHPEQADQTRDELELFLERPCEVFPAWEALPREGAAAGEIEADRLRLCTLLDRRRFCADSGPPPVVVAPVQALLQPVPRGETLRRHTLDLVVGRSAGDGSPVTPETLLAWAVDHGFERLPLVESPGDVARRGDIVDLFMPGENAPFRIEFNDVVIESIRRFDPGTQRSIEPVPAVRLTALPPEGSASGDDWTDLSSYLPEDAVVVLDEPTEIQSLGETIARRLGEPAEMFPVSDVLRRLGRFPQIHLHTLPAGDEHGENALDMGVRSLMRFDTQAAGAVTELIGLARTHEVHVVCDTEGDRTRLREMVAEQAPDVAERLRFHEGVLHRGFEWTETNAVVVAHHEIFHRHRLRRRVRKLYAGRPIETWTDLKPGERVVHVMHGIAVYRGLKRMRKGDSRQEEEFLCLEFADRAMIYVPCSQIDLVQKYVGTGSKPPELSRLGGKRWTRTKQKVADAVSELAESLLRIHALRESEPGTPYPADTEWQREFEAAFPYEETEDQLTVAAEIRADLMRPRPMDRLVCGDVGYGKTELAMRAAFKVVEYGRQVAVLVPTTVLAEQHERTFRERMAEYPFVIEGLSRFRTPGEQKRIVEDLRRGRIDIIIGTHRLLSKDVRFADLGLVIIDEEQRFGVEHKERLKAMRATVDVLTLTATPIPRTLHMALMGIRDISSLQTPPVDRRAIATQVCPFSRSLIREAILREMNRDGQVFFVHNFVRSIRAMAETVESIVPEARVVYAHGQMSPRELESVMGRFIRREADVLVCTTIIESGIDMPTVNTIFIDRAERFGLADLHQLRGRVGRSDHRAYCYLLLSPKHPPSPKAIKRLKAIEEFSDLGAGFRIAMRDLEIRGAGNLLGAEQSGHIAAVGYELYCRLVDQTVRRLKNEPDPHPPPVQIDLDMAAHIPRHYVASERSRLELYRRMVAARTEEDVAKLEEDLVDAFGPYPEEVKRLLTLSRLRIAARRFGIRSISRRPPDVVFNVEQIQKADPVFTHAPGTVRTPDAETIYWRPPPEEMEPQRLLAILGTLMTLAGQPTEART
ncbi:MAG: transcription-repair coupling factor [Planctomycetota bacterium]|nr:MAG: transcription-repair coupling factor [Planctomycetota bacterium]